MPNIKSAMKRVRGTEKKSAVNKHAKSEMRTLLKKTRLAIETGSETAAEELRKTEKHLHHLADRGHVHKNTVARWISRMNKSLNKK